MARITFRGHPVETVGTLPPVGAQAPDFCLAGTDLEDFTLDRFAGQRLVINIFAAVDTRVCAMSARTFNELASDLDNATVLCVSLDLPFSLSRFCLVQGLDRVVVGSAFRSSFGDDYGVTIVEGPGRGLFARAVGVLDETRQVVHSELVSEVMDQPNYEAALSAIGWIPPIDGDTIIG